MESIFDITYLDYKQYYCTLITLLKILSWHWSPQFYVYMCAYHLTLESTVWCIYNCAYHLTLESTVLCIYVCLSLDIGVHSFMYICVPISTFLYILVFLILFSFWFIIQNITKSIDNSILKAWHFNSLAGWYTRK